MIVSQTTDAEWQARFVGLPLFVPPTGPVLVIAPHPDDETLGAGALIWTLRQRGVPVTVVAATDGENAYDISHADRVTLATTRESEQADALARLGVERGFIHRLRLTDSGLTERQQELTAGVAHVVQDGMTLLAPWSGDFHPDHEACARAAAEVARSNGLPILSYFFWTWHRGRPQLLNDLPLHRFDASPEALAAKEDALRCHRSQLDREGEEPILPERLLGPSRWPYEVFLPHD